MSEVDDVRAFRNRLVAFADYVRANTQRVGPFGATRVDEAAAAHIAQEQAALTEEYGRLRLPIASVVGISTMHIPAIGTVSQDVIVDAINRTDWAYWTNAVGMARQQIDLAIGQMARRQPASADRIYRLTSPWWWLQRVGAVIRAAFAWLWSSNRRRIATVVGALALAIIGGIASGWAQAVFTPR